MTESNDIFLEQSAEKPTPPIVTPPAEPPKEQPKAPPPPPPTQSKPTPEPEPTSRFLQLLKRPWLVVAISLFLVAAAIGFSVNRIMSTVLHSRPEVVVPKIEGKSLMEALGIVSTLDLSLQQDGTDFDESLPAGTVLRQQPPSGMQVRAGRALRVTISKGGEVVFVPIVVGKPVAEAQSILATAGIQMGAVNESYSLDVAKGLVLNQSPDPNAIVTRGAMVDVELSKGLPPAGLPLVPDFIGKSLDQARTWAADVNATVIPKEDSQAVGAAGTVVKQDPRAGQPLLEGQNLKVTITSLSGGQGSRFAYQVASDAGSVTVKIVARDSRGESTLYEGKHKGGDTVEVPVGVTATTRFRVYVDDVLKEERVVEP